MAEWPIEANACFVIKPMVMRGEKEQFVYWGDTVVATANGARRRQTSAPQVTPAHGSSKMPAPLLWRAGAPCGS